MSVSHIQSKREVVETISHLFPWIGDFWQRPLVEESRLYQTT